jgi:hypothetical protein
MHTGGPTRAPSGSSYGAVAVRQELRGELLMGEVCRQQAGGAACVAACVRCCAVAERSHHQIPASGDPVNGFFRRPVGGVCAHVVCSTSSTRIRAVGCGRDHHSYGCRPLHVLDQ